MAAALLTPGMPLRAAPLRQANFVPPQAFVKVNQFYLLYTYPVIPYLDKSGALMVGLEGFARALFAKAPPGDAQAKIYGGNDYGRVTTDTAARRETLTLGDHLLTFTANSTTVQADGTAAAMGAPARWDAATGQMVVTAASLARALGLTCRWDRRVVTITAPPDMVATNRDGDFGVDPDTPDYDAVVPWRVTYRGSGLPAGLGGENHTRQRLIPWLAVEARNVSGGLIFQEALNVQVLYDNGGMSSNLEGLSEPSRYSHYGPELVPGQLRRFAVSLQGYHDTALCVISIPASTVPFIAAKPTRG